MSTLHCAFVAHPEHTALLLEDGCYNRTPIKLTPVTIPSSSFLLNLFNLSHRNRTPPLPLPLPFPVYVEEKKFRKTPDFGGGNFGDSIYHTHKRERESLRRNRGFRPSHLQFAPHRLKI
ncbi:hypothetical protein V6N13_122474 [Hibiscus sabdariffa]|uniref:Uncharacterized protein n=1 Tax=Hibiscus sabdariffa TaxID=183260 RepID=A0ABR2Q7M1_9ROSI